MKRTQVVLSGLAALIMVGASLEAKAQGEAGHAAECTRLAASPHDTGLTAGGVGYDAIDAALAIPACEKAVAENPSDGRLRSQLGRALDKAERYDEAMKAYQAAADAGFTLAIDLIGSLYEYGDGVEQDYAKAAEFYRQAADAGEPRGMVDLGTIYENGWGRPKDTVEAERLYRSALSKGRPVTVGDAQNQLAYMFTKENIRLEEAESFARSAVANAESSGVDHATRLDTLAYILHKQGKNEEALSAQLKSISLLDEEEAFYFARLGDIYDALGRHDEARTAWQKAFDLPVDDSAFDPSYDLDRLKARIAGQTTG